MCNIAKHTLPLSSKQQQQQSHTHTQTHKRIKTVTQRGTQRMETQEEPNGQGPRKGKSTTIRKRRCRLLYSNKKVNPDTHFKCEFAFHLMFSIVCLFLFF